MSKLKDMAKKFGIAALDKLAEPQRLALQAAAKASGAMPEGESSEAASQAIVQAVADKLGLPDSTLTNVAKALGVAGLETFADPLGPLGKLGKAVKGAEAVGKGAKVLGMVDDASAAAKKAQAMKNIVEAMKLRKEAQAAKAVVPAVAEVAKPLTQVEQFAKVAAKKPVSAAESLQQEERMRAILKSKTDQATYKPGLQEKVARVKPIEESAAGRIGRNQQKYEKPKVKKPEGETYNFEQLKEAMKQKNRGR